MPSLSGFYDRKWNALFALWMLHGVFAFWQLLTLPSDNHAFLLGLSAQRILAILLVLFWVFLNFGMIVIKPKDGTWLGAQLQNANSRDLVFMIVSLVVLFRAWLAVLMSLFSGRLMLQYAGYLDRLLPVVNLISYVCLEILILVLFSALREKEFFQRLSPFLIKFTIVLTLLCLVAGLITFTRLGIAPVNSGDWSRGLPAVPLLEWQIILASLFCLGMAVFESREKIIRTAYIDRWICLAIWLFTVGLWLSQPVIPNASALKPRAPNFEIYPFIDAQVYDQYAQSALIGNGFGTDEIPQRPLYIVFLTFAHVLVGQNYRNVIAFQSVVLAIFPVLLYLFGTEFFGRPIGISIALLAILRDYTSNIVSPFTGNLSYSKLYLSEIPTAIFLILFLLVGMRWIKAGFPLFSGYLLGGILGTAILIRTQVVVALPVIVLFALLVQTRKVQPLLRSVFFMLLTIALVVSPWFWRNWRITGKLMFDNPESQTINLALRYSRLNGIEPDVMPRPGESISDYDNRLKATAWDAISFNPGGAIKGIANSFLNHAVNNVLLFPLRNDLKDFRELWSPTDAFWEKWEGRPTVSQSLLLAAYIALFGLGVATAWYRNGWLGFLPLALNLVYNLWTSLALLSGQRFMLTMDWSIYLYYMIGIFALLSGFLFFLGNGRDPILKWYKSNPFPITQSTVAVTWRQYLLAGFLFLAVGASLPLTEKMFPKRYPPIAQDQILKGLLVNQALDQSKVNSLCLQKVVDQNELSIVRGRALYPRYYASGDGERFTDAGGYKAAEQGRLVFEMVGQANNRIIFPMTESPDFFPNAADVTIFLDKTSAPWLLFMKQGNVEGFYVSDSIDYALCK